MTTEELIQIQKEVNAELEHSLAIAAYKQKSCILLAPSQSALIPCNANGQTPAGQIALQIQRDGDFVLDRIAIFAKGPVDRNGFAPQVPFAGGNQVQTAFPSGLSSFNSWNISDAGLAVQVSESGSGVKWFDGYADLPVMATPGYSGILYQTFPVHAYLSGGSTLQFDFRNKDIATLDSTVIDANSDSCLFHYVSIALFGEKYLGNGLNA